MKNIFNLKTIQFVTCISIICLIKTWIDALRLIMPMISSTNIDIMHIAKYFRYLNVIGLTVGGIIVGLFTDTLGAKKIGIASMSVMIILSIIIFTPFIFSENDFIKYYGIFFIAIVIFFLNILRILTFVAIDKNAASKGRVRYFLRATSQTILNSLLGYYLYRLSNIMIEALFIGADFDKIYIFENFNSVLILNMVIHLLFCFNNRILNIVQTCIAAIIGLYMWHLNYSITTITGIYIYSSLPIMLSRVKLGYILYALTSLINFLPYLWTIHASTLLLCQPFRIFIYLCILLHGICLASAMNAGYATIGNIYKDNPFLNKATSILYMCLFGILAILPIFIYSVQSLRILLIFSIINCVSIICWPNAERSALKLKDSLQRAVKVIQNKNILLSACVSMLFIGGFYNIISILITATYPDNNAIQFLKKCINLRTYFFHQKTDSIDFEVKSLPRKIYSIARMFTLLANVSLLIMPKKYKNSPANCATYILSTLFISIITGAALIVASIWKCYYTFGIITIIMIHSLTLGIAQAVIKSFLLNVANKSSTAGVNLCGSAQSLVTFGNSFIEWIGCILIPINVQYSFQTGIITYGAIVVSLSIIGMWYTLRNKVSINAIIAPSEN